MRRWILDRYLLREWFRILAVTAVGFPLIVIAFELTDNLDEHLSRGIAPGAIAMAYAYSIPEKMSVILPAAVLFATVFSLGSWNRHSELTAAKASGRSLTRAVWPLLGVATLAAAVTLALGEWAPTGTKRQLELLGEREVRSTSARYNFVYRADHGWVYAARALDIKQQSLRDLVLEREGRGPVYPTLVIQSPDARYSDTTSRWMLRSARFRVLPALDQEVTFAFDSLVQRSLVETPAGLLVEPKDPREMRYAELGRYINDLERSGGDGRKLRVRRALKIAIPFTCIVIALFGAPLAVTAPRSSGAMGVGISLVTTVVFLMLIQLSEAIGAGGLLPPLVAAWLPNLVFGAAGVGLLVRAPT
ncbi:MAG TPA: LptF/LptG family permease [Gemmatimonadales bacterium]|nr:LptF/LptG family permease [Gemmatimonadales bacterium]